MILAAAIGGIIGVGIALAVIAATEGPTPPAHLLHRGIRYWVET